MDNFNLSALMQESATAQETLLKQTRGLVKKWKPTGLLDGLVKEHDVHGMAVLLENQARQLLAEETKTTIGNGEQWAGVALPLVRKIFGEIAAKEFVSVQPMNLPSGLVFYMDFRYGTTKDIRTAGDSLYGITSGSGTIPTGGLYGSGKFGYSINNQSASVAITTASAGSYPATSASVNFQNIDPTVLTVYAVPTSNFTNPDLFSVRAWNVASGSATAIAGVLPEFTFVSSSAGTQNVYFVAPTVANTAFSLINYQVQPIDSQRGDFEDRVGTSIFTATPTGVDLNIPQIDLQLRSEPIVAKTRKLKAVWTPELAQDLNAYHSIDAEAELTAMLSEYISLEIDLEILDMLILNAQTVDYWSAQIGTQWNGTNFAVNSFVGTAWTNMTWYQTLGQKIQKVSNVIHQLTMRGGANFVVCSPQVSTILESIPGFSVNTDGEKAKYPMGVTQIGSFQSRFTIYKNPYLTTNVILMGYKGNNFLETGAVYAPYVPLVMTPLIYDPENFTPRRGVLTRYAKKITRPEFYGKIIVQGLTSV